METIELHIEAIIFSAKQAVTEAEIISTLEKTLEIPVSAKQVQQYIEQLTQKYNNGNFSYELTPISDGYQFLTKTAYHKTISVFLNLKARKKLSTSALETLSIIAYKQPITKAEIEQIRGVNCDYSIQKLLEKELIEIAGRSEVPGRPLLYGTTQLFMDYFGLHTLSDLPKLKEIQPQTNQIGTPE
ncbi:SMC-Scp complex subunit ScpB [Sphingobacteriales bacterium UPWRP_1]|nr:SMC-Scp complex subunit ScpB [Sphingobacteriales bacterium TSM_CSS]PSJ71686.1 SMC-Scp complex subunit ScpB [Sphingobacteriales bacterium UPWRP_1]